MPKIVQDCIDLPVTPPKPTISENESTILLFGVGRDYEFIDEEKESGDSGVMRSMPC